MRLTPYEYVGIAHNFGPDFLVRLNLAAFDLTLLLEVKSYEDDKTQAKHGAAKLGRSRQQLGQVWALGLPCVP
ncbi:hypothetical protein [Allochromatium palmeri]|uniref:Uncharacterized protein n=1 Tax=Allochromatium palmeri TaxID=231048 RepID=A0A6N8E875_9GAMM|nr:hypothetical protein [Allochromatium palmeri]MTW19538.1 hypothetical protein [Allochromatium palmeri]